MSDKPRMTLAAIAAEAGVSLATMSKVLNGRTDVSPATRARLEEHLARHGYTKRTAAADPRLRPRRRRALPAGDVARVRRLLRSHFSHSARTLPRNN